MQVQGFEQAWSSVGQTRQYVGALDCARTVWLQEGILGFYKGTTPSLLKVRLKACDLSGVRDSFVQRW